MEMPLTALQRHLECPVCYEQLADRIVQCKKGHSVCITCSEGLDRCPICRETYLGTRNFALEEVIRKLKDLKATAAKIPVVPTPNTTAPPATPSPIQGQGSFLCRVIECGTRLPICRLYNHLRSSHSGILREYRFPFSPQNPVFGIKFTFPTTVCRTEYISISGAGLFALVFKVHNIVQRKRPIFCWLQQACSNHDAREFSFRLTVTMNNRFKAEYSDYVHGDQSDEAYIQSKMTCLHMVAPLYIKNIVFTLDIFKTERHRGAPRGVETEWHDI